MSSMAVELQKANDAFYLAFQKLDIEKMKDIWLDSDETKCIHPGWPALFGYEKIIQSWQGIFLNTEYVECQATDTWIMQHGLLGVVSNTEIIHSPNQGSLKQARVKATNVFLFEENSWKMVIHHASAA